MILTKLVSRNFDIMMFSFEALDMLTAQDLVTYENLSYVNKGWPLLSSWDILQIRHNNDLRNQYIESQISILNLIELIYMLRDLISKEHVFSLIKNLLAIHKKTVNYSVNSKEMVKISKFLERFRFLFRKYINERAINVAFYQDDVFLDRLAITNIYSLLLLTQKNGYSYFWMFITRYDFLEQ